MGGRVLLADDSITIQKVVELTFAETDHEVVAVGNGRELLERIGEVRPDVVLCDVVMPDVNGYDVCQELKSNPDTLHIPVVLLTGTFEPFDRNKALAVGCDAIITKPFEAEELVRTVDDLMRKPSSTGAPTQADEGIGVPEDVEGIDFTTTGFESMSPPETEAAPAVPEEGIDFTSSGASAPDLTPPVSEPSLDPDSAAGEAPFGEAADVAGTDGGHDSPFEFGGAAADEAATDLSDEEGAAFEAADAVVGDDDGATGSGEEPADAGEPPTPVEAAAPTLGTAPAPFEAAAEEPEIAAEEPEIAAEEPEMPAGEAAEPADIPAAQPETAGGAAVVSMPAGSALSEEDVERVARKVLELAEPLIERLAWEIVPDMAEMLVRKRIRELEEAAEQEE